MSLVGYARVSTEDQDLALQLEALTEAGCERIFSERLSGASREQRWELAKCLASLEEGDVLVVTKLDRLARSMADLTAIVANLVARKVGFRCLHQSAIDTTSVTGRLMLNVLGAFAEFEREMIAERRSEGIARAKALGKYKGRKPQADRDEARRLWLDEGLRGQALAERLGCSVHAVYRYTAGMGTR